ncbi:hypothetical protein C8R43DRAFT_1045838 [Mycena crocata]|nr:hypothetical protein C8R43DRAFT_1045838 [Mycena crocata]
MQRCTQSSTTVRSHDRPPNMSLGLRCVHFLQPPHAAIRCRTLRAWLHEASVPSRVAGNVSQLTCRAHLCSPACRPAVPHTAEMPAHLFASEGALVSSAVLNDVPESRIVRTGLVLCAVSISRVSDSRESHAWIRGESVPSLIKLQHVVRNCGIESREEFVPSEVAWVDWCGSISGIRGSNSHVMG